MCVCEIVCLRAYFRNRVYTHTPPKLRYLQCPPRSSVIPNFSGLWLADLCHMVCVTTVSDWGTKCRTNKVLEEFQSHRLISYIWKSRSNYDSSVFRYRAPFTQYLSVYLASIIISILLSILHLLWTIPLLLYLSIFISRITLPIPLSNNYYHIFSIYILCPFFK